MVLWSDLSVQNQMHYLSVVSENFRSFVCPSCVMIVDFHGLEYGFAVEKILLNDLRLIVCCFG